MKKLQNENRLKAPISSIEQVVLSNSKLDLKTPTKIEFQKVCEYIHEFELDNRDLKQKQFSVALSDNELFGFGRLREHIDCMELCSLGVAIPYRRNGIGKAIVEQLIKNSDKNIYLVCIIPDYFSPFGFKETINYPEAIQDKINYCTDELVVPEKYVAMVLER